MESPDKGKYWLVSARSAKWGLNQRKIFSTEELALNYARDLEAQVIQDGKQSDIPKEKLQLAASYERLVTKLLGYGRTPEEAVDHFLAQPQSLDREVPKGGDDTNIGRRWNREDRPACALLCRRRLLSRCGGASLFQLPTAWFARGIIGGVGQFVAKVGFRPRRLASKVAVGQQRQRIRLGLPTQRCYGRDANSPPGASARTQ